VDRNGFGDERVIADAGDVVEDSLYLVADGEPLDVFAGAGAGTFADVLKTLGSESGGFQAGGQQIAHDIVGEKFHTAIGVVNDEVIDSIGPEWLMQQLLVKLGERKENRSMKWKITFAFVFVVACWLCFPGNAGAQQGYCFNSSYSSYTSTTVGSDHASIIQTVQTSGYISLNNPAVWAGPLTGWIYPCTGSNNQMLSTSHTYNIRNLVGSTGGNYSQGPTPALNYNTYSITITPPATPGTVYSSDSTATVVCPIAGIIFTGGGSNFIEIAYTRLFNMGGPWTNCTIGKVTTVCDIPVKSWCGMSTTPPDYNPTKVRAMTFPFAPASFWDAYALCIRPLGFGPFYCPGAVALDLPAPQDAVDCTHNWQ